MAKDEKRVAFLGAGYIAEWHGEALKRTPGARLTGVCDLSESAARSCAETFGADHVFTSLQDLIDADICDAVHILTPPDAHVEPAQAVLEAGLAAFVEKPLALSAQDGRALDALARRTGARLGVNHNFLMLPSYERLKRDIETGVIGPIDTLEANWQFPLAPLRSGPFGIWMLRRPQNILFEIGPHLFAFVADLFGRLDNIDVRLRNPSVIPGGETHFQSWRISGDANGAAVTLNVSLIEGHDRRTVSVRGLGASAEYDFAADAYRMEQTPMQDIVLGPLAAQASIAGQAAKTGVVNAFRQLRSMNSLSPYGLSITNAVAKFYNDWNVGAGVDTRLSAATAAAAATMMEAALDAAAPTIKAAQSSGANASVAQSSSIKGDADPENGKTILVIGGTGFIGRALVTTLADRGYKVRVYSRGAGAGMARPDGRVSVFTGSLKSSDDLIVAMDGVDGVFHLARATETSWRGYLENDVGVTRKIGEACLAAGVKRLVYTGTIDSYDASQAERAISEDTPFDPDLERRNLYARSKAACEAALLELHNEKGLPLVIARPGIVIGKGGPLQHWGLGMWRGATSVKLWGDGRNVLPLVLVDDVADGLVKTMEVSGVEGDSFNLIGEPMLSANDYFDAVGAANSVRMRARPTPIWTYYLVDVAKYYAKRYLARKPGLTKPSYRDWKSRAQLSPFRIDKSKTLLNWRPEADRTQFIERGIVDARLFGLDPRTAALETDAQPEVAPPAQRIAS